jgi:hypothetical protein
MKDEPATLSRQTVAEPPLTLGSWVVLSVVWTLGLVSWAFWGVLVGYLIWRFFGGSPQTS